MRTFVISVSSSVKRLCCCPFSNWFGAFYHVVVFFFNNFLFTLLDQVVQSCHTPLSVLSPQVAAINTLPLLIPSSGMFVSVDQPILINY